MLRNAAKFTLENLRSKLQIAIPENLGRSMLGVIDETGMLNHGQVYIRYTVNVRPRKPGPGARRITHIGPVLITKNPMVCEMFGAKLFLFRLMLAMSECLKPSISLHSNIFVM
jgi:hypothetical protein